jgi:purine-nucleoside phosphorylase
MPQPTVAGHPGTFSWGLVGETRVYCLAGRKHAYEGVSLELVCFGVQLVHRLGCRVFCATNAAGGALPSMQAGAFMAITDHTNLIHRSPFAQICDHPRYTGPRHPDVCACI